MSSSLRNDGSVAVLSDIHGNRWALEAVLADMARRGVVRCVDLGDCVYGPLDPAGTIRLLMARDDPTVRGNEDRILCEPGAAGADASGDASTLGYVLRRLDPGQLAWLSGLPRATTLRDEMVLFHGTPERDDAYLLHDVAPEGAVKRETAEIERLLSGVRTRVVLCGHDHTPFAAKLPDGRLIVNPGSVGLQAYSDDVPYPHVMETGTPHARYCILTPAPSGWDVEQAVVEYDWRVAAETASRNGRPDWARRLETGCA
jgi:predicted phosphodiesterase